MKFLKVKKQGKGRAIQNMVQLVPGDKVKAIMNVKNLEDKDFTESHNIVLVYQKRCDQKNSLGRF
jgi:DNA gyrase subunit A